MPEAQQNLEPAAAREPVRAPEEGRAASVTASAPSPEASKPKGLWQQTQAAFQSILPDWAIKHSSRINQLGLMAGTTVILGSAFRNRTIAKDIWNAQVKILEEKGLKGAELEQKIGELVTSKVMKKPGLHRQRMFYLGTAISGLGVGGFLKDKETPEDRAKYKDMPLPNYLLMRLGHAFDPIHHSRQTAGLLGATSGVLAMISGLSQPGGALISEIFVGGTLLSGFTLLGFINDPGQAKEWLNKCWAARLPFVVTGTYETLFPPPTYPTPLMEAEKLKPEYASGLAKAMEEGVRVPRFGLGMGKYTLAGRELLTGEKAAAAFTKSFMSRPLPYKRMDISYPIGQWFNMAMATFGFLTAGADEKKKAAPEPKEAVVIAPESAIAEAAPVALHAAQPSSRVNAVQADARLADHAPVMAHAQHA